MINRLEKFKELWNKGVKSDEIARKIGIPENMVPVYAIAAGLIPRKLLRKVWNRKITAQVLVYMRDMFLDGVSITEIAECFEVDLSTARYHLHSIGLEKRKVRRAREKITKEKLKELSVSGYTDKEIAEYFGVSPQYIMFLRKRYGIYKRGLRELRHLEHLQKIADVIMEEIDKKCYTTNREMQQRGFTVNWSVLRKLEDFIEGLQWFRIRQTSTQKYTVLPAYFSGLIVIYVEGCEERVAEFLKRNLNEVPRKVFLHLLKNWSAPEKLRNFF